MSAYVTGEARPPVVSVIMPVRNEGPGIRGVVQSALAQTGVAPADLELIVADGMSDDGTLKILLELAASDSRVRVVRNLGQIVSTGLNAAIREAKGEFIVRMDAHTRYASDYVTRCVETLVSTNADNVGGPWIAEGIGYLQTAIALAFQSQFSSGGAGSHRVDFEGQVDSVYLGCWRKSTFSRVGLFDEGLVRNQDDEWNLRLTRAGGRIWQTPAIRSWYRPRASLIALFKQYLQYGYWKVRVIQKHRLPASVRHIVPGLFLCIMIALVLVAPSSPLAASLAIYSLWGYGVAVAFASLSTCRYRVNWRYLPVMPWVFISFHLGYGVGTVCGVCDFMVFKRSGRDLFQSLTR